MIYEFECKCKNIIEKDCKLGQKTAVCPKCGKRAQRILSATAFKVNGFSYSNHYGLKEEKREDKKNGNSD